MFFPVLCCDCLGLNRPILGSLNNYRFFTKSSSETQGQIMGTRESLNGRKNVARRKVKNGAKSRSSRRSLLLFVPHFPVRLDFPSSPLSAPGSPMMLVNESFQTRETFSLVLERGQPEAAPSCQIPGHFNVGTGRKTRLMARFVLFCFFCYSRLFTQHLLRLQILKLKGNI